MSILIIPPDVWQCDCCRQAVSQSEVNAWSTPATISEWNQPHLSGHTGQVPWQRWGGGYDSLILSTILMETCSLSKYEYLRNYFRATRPYNTSYFSCDTLILVGLYSVQVQHSDSLHQALISRNNLKQTITRSIVYLKSYLFTLMPYRLEMLAMSSWRLQRRQQVLTL